MILIVLNACSCVCICVLGSFVAQAQDKSGILEQQVASLKGMVSSSESQQEEQAKSQMQKITALQEQVNALKASSRTAQSECTSLKSELAEATRKEQEVGAGRVSLGRRVCDGVQISFQEVIYCCC